MPDFDFEPEEIRILVAYVQSMRKGSVVRPAIAGDPQLGRAIYAQNGCTVCHQVGEVGGVYGPALTRVGGVRSYEYLQESIVNPSADIADEYKGVTVIEKDGHEYTGVRINEDTFTIQLRLPDQHFRSFEKDSLRNVQYLSDSLMPAYRLKDADLQNLLAYLSTLRDAAAAPAPATKQPGIH
jgi:cytochrome c oxidase cbb3-type subunit III